MHNKMLSQVTNYLLNFSQKYCEVGQGGRRRRRILSHFIYTILLSLFLGGMDDEVWMRKIRCNIFA